jgi:hypothetical protein
MPEIILHDSDDDPIWSEPVNEPEWDVDGDPAKMNTKALCAAVARDMLDCKIKWWGYYCDWCCGCEGTPHGCDQQCSAIGDADQLYRNVLEVCEDVGIEFVAGSHEKMLRNALLIWRTGGWYYE